MGIPDHLTCLLRNLYADQEATGIAPIEVTGKKQTRDHTLGREDGVGADRVGERLLSHSLGRGPEC